LTRTMTILALACCLVTGVAVAAVLSRDGLPTASFIASPPPPVEAEPTANRDRKADRLPMQTAARDPGGDAALPEPLPQAVATDVPADVEVLPPAVPVVGPPLPRPRPKLANQLIQKNYSLLSDMQIAALKGRLQLTRAQEPYWPAVENALRDVARKIHEWRSAAGTPALISSDVEQIKAAAQPLLSRLREEQKREARALARIIGLEAVASLI
jgi:hypothetical protein